MSASEGQAPASDPGPAAGSAESACEAPAPPAGKAVRRRRPLRGLLRILGVLTFQVLLLTLILAGWFLGTQTGLRRALALAEDLSPGVFRVSQAQGRVLGRLRLEDIQVRLPTLELKLGRLDLDWSPSRLLGGTLRIHRIHAQDIDLAMTPSEDAPPEPLILREIVLPLGLELGEFLVERLRVFELGAETPRAVLERGLLEARLRGSSLGLSRLELDIPQPRLSARGNGEAELRGHYPLGLDLSWSLDLPSGARLEGQGHVDGDLTRLNLVHQVSGSARVRLDAEVSDLMTAPSWTGRVQLDGLDLPDFAAEAPSIDLSGLLETQGDLQSAGVSGALEGRAQDHPDLGHLEAALDLQWQGQVLALHTLDLQESVSGARVALSGQLDLRQAPGSFALEGSWERLRWPLTGPSLAESPTGRLEASGSLDAFAYSLSGVAQGPDLPALALDLKGTGDRRGTHIEPLEVKALDGTLRADGSLAWDPGLGWDLKVEGKDLNPSVIAAGLDGRLGFSLDTQGGLDGFTYQMLATTQGPVLPQARLAAEGSGDQGQVQIQSLRLEALAGLLEGQGRVGWDPGVSWEARLNWSDIDPGVLAPEWAGRLEGRVESQGTLEADGPHLSALIDGVRGEMRGLPVAANGRVDLAGRSLRVQGLDAYSGPTRLRAEGALQETELDLSFDLSSPDLSTLLPTARGRVEANGRLGGTPRSPKIKLDLEARGVGLGGHEVGSLTGAVDVVATTDGPFNIRLDASDLVAGALRFEGLEVRGEGAMPDHRLSVGLRGQPLSARLEAKGAMAPDRSYQGTLSRLDLDSPPWGSWRLQRAAPLSLAGARFGVGPVCLRNAQGSGGCLGLDQPEPGRWDAEIDLDPLGVELIQALLPPNLAAEGQGRVKGRFQAQGALLKGSGAMELPTGRLRIVRGNGAGQVLDLSGARLTLDAGPKGLDGRLELPLQGLGSVRAELGLPGWRLDQATRPDQPLRGQLRAGADGLSRFSSLVPDLTGVTGGIEADLSLAGTLGGPQLRGQGSVRGLGAQVPLIGLRLADLDINLVAELDRLDLQGQGTIGGGRLELSGDYRLAQGGGAGRARVIGERLKVADTKEYFVVLSPTFDLELNPQGLRVRGEVRIPEARIRPRALPEGTVSGSSDVVMLDRAGDVPGPPFPLDLDVRLRLGDEVSIDAFGVRGRLTGDLRVFQEPGKQMLGDGQLAIADGLYRLSAGFRLAAEIGAPLTIEQGRLVFAKSPIGNPGLLIQAQREGGDTTAGVQVLGTLRNPKLAFFSESDPDMTQAEITTYLLTGVPPRRNSGGGDQALSLGAYVRPKLYMEYETGLGDQKDKVKLRYDLTRRIEIQTETGEGQGGDIFFKFER